MQLTQSGSSAHSRQMTVLRRKRTSAESGGDRPDRRVLIDQRAELRSSARNSARADHVVCTPKTCRTAASAVSTSCSGPMCGLQRRPRFSGVYTEVDGRAGWCIAALRYAVNTSLCLVDCLLARFTHLEQQPQWGSASDFDRRHLRQGREFSVWIGSIIWPSAHTPASTAER